LEVLINNLSKDKFEILVNNKQKTIHQVYLSDEVHLDFTNNKISKEELIKFSFEFLLEREPNTSILSSFELNIISKYFPEYLLSVKKFCNI
tara:strand:+ start:183 stop:455 length:273 start_codon:yes stop_codon:yes gene_type:complete